METELTESITETTARALNNNNANADSAGKILNNSGSVYWTIIVYLVVVILIIAGLFFVRKYLLNRLGSAKSGAYMKIIDRLVISQDKQIILIETRNKVLIVGVTPQRMETLSEFSKEEFGSIETEDNINKNAGSNFLSMLSGKFNFKDGGEK